MTSKISGRTLFLTIVASFTLSLCSCSLSISFSHAQKFLLHFSKKFHVVLDWCTMSFLKYSTLFYHTCVYHLFHDMSFVFSLSHAFFKFAYFPLPYFSTIVISRKHLWFLWGIQIYTWALTSICHSTFAEQMIWLG